MTWYSGDATWPRAKLVPLTDYEREMKENGVRCVVLRPAGATRQHGELAAEYWLGNIEGDPYDITIYVNMLAKSFLGLGCVLPNWEWGKWCSEANMIAWREGACIDPWGKQWCTPRTTENRWKSGKLVEVPRAIVSGVFNRSEIWPGDTLHVWGTSWISKRIEAYLRDGSHDGLLIQK
ncbi:MAG: hypothetical protein ABII82_10260 [Verrucomicrobiota bacterium]